VLHREREINNKPSRAVNPGRKEKKMFYIITYANGEGRYGNFNSYAEALDYAEARNKEGYDFTIEEWESEEAYLES
jgi:hypothetical protein